jgi:hypothetical protein
LKIIFLYENQNPLGGKFFAEAEDCLLQALQIFEAHQTPISVMRDLKQKLTAVAKQ